MTPRYRLPTVTTRLASVVRRLGPVAALLVLAMAAGAAPEEKAVKRAYLAGCDAGTIAARVAALEAEPAPLADQSAADAVCLLYERIYKMRSSEHTVIENYVYRVRDPERSAVTDHTREFPSQSVIEAADTWILRDGVLTHAGSESVRIVEGGKEAPMTVVMAMREVRPGDVIGLSLKYTLPWPLYGMTAGMFLDVPVRQAVLVLDADGCLRYRQYGFNLKRGQWRSEVLRRSRNVETLIRWTVTDVPAVAPGPLAPPPLRAGPAIHVLSASSCALRIGNFDNWNRVAVVIDDWCSRLFEADLDLTKTAVRQVDGHGTARERMRALQSFVRERIVITHHHRPVWFTSAASILRTRTATRFQAGALLYTMAREAGLNVRAVFAQSADYGPFDKENYGIPMFSDVVVELIDEPGTYFCVSARPQDGGGLTPDLMGVSALIVKPGVGAKDEEIAELALKRYKSESMEAVNREYLRLLESASFYTLFELPGDPTELQGTLEEEVFLDPDSGDLDLAVTSGNPQSRVDLSAWAPYVDQGARKYWAWRFPELAAPADSAQSQPDTLRLSAGAALARVTGDVFTVPAAVAYGPTFLAEWPGPPLRSFYSPITRIIRRSFRLRIPSGYEVASRPASVAVDLPEVTIRAQAQVVGDELVVVREFIWRHAVTTRQALGPLEQAFSAMRAFEQTPLLIARQ